jgi:ubiquinone/menaquinone biosynthesis C-methylase UbiE
MAETLRELHEHVPPDYYDVGIKNNRLQRLWHRRRFLDLKSFIRKPAGRILDIGCHSGLFTKEIVNQNNNIQVYGIDISRSAIKQAKKRIPAGHFFHGDAHKLPFNSAYFDQIFCLEMLEHVEHPEQVIAEMKRVLKKNGTGVILIPTDSKLFAVIWFLWNTYSRVWTHTHIQSFNDRTLTQLLEKAGLNITRMKKTHLSMLLLVEFRK